MTFKLQESIQQLVGKTLVKLQFGCVHDENEAEEPGTRYFPQGKKIISAEIGVTEGDLDPCVWMTLEGGAEIYAYDNEEITVE